MGGGIYNNSGTINNCKIYLNNANRSGGGIYNTGSEGMVTNSVLYSNSADDVGGIYNQSGMITNCTIYFSYGAGILNRFGTTTNSVSWKNYGGDILGKPRFTSFSCFGEAYNENGNIRGNPLFINTFGDSSTWDFHLQNGSPCIDKGTTDTAQLPDKDKEGNLRPGGDGKVCMGAYESLDHYTPLSPEPPSRIYVSKTGSNTNGGSWEDAYTSITMAICLLEDNLYDIWIKEGIYQEQETIFVPGRVNLYGGFNGIETSREERNIYDNPTIIDGAQTYRCVNNCGYMDGFYVRNGKGGGIYNYNGKVINCTLYSNSARSGGGIRNNYGTVSNSTLYSNSADLLGGGIDNLSGTVTNCAIYSNLSDISGGIANTNGTVSNCMLYSNSARIAGGIGNTGSVNNCTLYANSAIEDGGGISHGFGVISNCIIHFNTAGNLGGGIYNEGYHGFSSIYNCILSYNMNWGIYNKSGGVFNCTLYNNGGGINNVDDYISGYVMNCISWKNGETDIQGGIVSYSCFKEATGTDGNINADPMFINVDGNVSSWIYQVKNGSPCIDEGDPDVSYNDACQPPGK